jgi:glycosyltransferase involved in cell wall biosynthesis
LGLSDVDGSRTGLPAAPLISIGPADHAEHCAEDEDDEPRLQRLRVELDDTELADDAIEIVRGVDLDHHGDDGDGAKALATAADRAVNAGLRRIEVVAWRDLDDPEAGGSELHAHRVAALWAEAGLEVVLRTSRADGHAALARRDGYRVVRRGGRYGVFPLTAARGTFSAGRLCDGVVEIWNGMPFFAPLWARCPHMVFLHHVHAEMWGMVLPPRLARAGELIERRVAPPLYRRTRVVTLSSSSRDEIVSMLGLRDDRVSVVPPGVDPRFSPAGERAPYPLVVAVERFEGLIDALADARRCVGALQAIIVGEGYERTRLEAHLRARGASEWVELRGRVSDDELISLYRRAWVLASASLREGWGMTVTEAGACATPAVVTRIAGHEDAVEHGRTGLLVDDPRQLAGGLATVLGDPALRDRLGAAAAARARCLTWEATAAGTLDVLAGEAEARRR